jgi:hypothetical protein
VGDLNEEERRYAEPRQRKLDPGQEHAIRVAASHGSSLRALAADHGMSHQTVASIVGHQATSEPQALTVGD